MSFIFGLGDSLNVKQNRHSKWKNQWDTSSAASHGIIAMQVNLKTANQRTECMQICVFLFSALFKHYQRPVIFICGQGDALNGNRIVPTPADLKTANLSTYCRLIWVAVCCSREMR